MPYIEVNPSEIVNTPNKFPMFDSEGPGYDYTTAEQFGIKPDETGHWPSREPTTGQILKGKGHKTFNLTIKGEEEAGYNIFKGKNGRYYSQPEESIGGFIPISEEEAIKAKKPPSRLAPAYETVKSMGTAWGPLEVGAELVSGIPGFIAGGITSGVKAVYGKKEIPYADKLVELLESTSITYKPKTASGQQLESALANIFITARESGQKVADVTLEYTGSPLLSTIVGTTVAGIPEILMAVAGIKKGLKPKGKVSPTRFPTTEEWTELKQPPPEQLEYKPKVEPKTLEVPPELHTKALPPGQGFVILNEKPKTILRAKPPSKGREILISESGEPITPENVIPQELKTKALPPAQGFIILDEKPTIMTKKTPVVTAKGKTIVIKPEEVPPTAQHLELMPEEYPKI